jgi:23S rRNA U2552 (ribose-2'-O)-methylase RlmE/FtsJ
MTITDNQTLFYTVHQIDNDDYTPSKVNIITSDSKNFTNKLFLQELRATNKRSFKFARESSETAQLIGGLINEIENENFEAIFEARADLLAEKLLDVQKKRAAKHTGINAPKKGGLVVIFLKGEDKINILISKIDHATFLHLEDSLYKSGLPDEKATQKSCIINYQLVDDEYQLMDIIVSDSTPKIASFWSEDFLQLEELTSDDTNTTNAFTAIEHVISTYVKKKSSGDYEELRNNLVGYFKTKTSFKYEDMVEYVIGEYTPEKEDIIIEKLKEQLNKLPEKQGFDTTFNIVTSRIKARFKRTYKVSEKIELRTSDYIEDLKNVIVAKEDPEFGGRILVIRNINENLYNTFKSEED